MSRPPLRIVKIGGSLFDLPDLADRVRKWLVEQSPTRHVFIAGGGALVEEVRRWQRSPPLDEETAHWICIDLMSITSRLLHAALPEIPRTTDIRDLVKPADKPDAMIYDPISWLKYSEQELRGQILRIGWDTTSDSIAARVAFILSAKELVLMKSTLPGEELTMEQLADSGYVDRMLPRLAEDLRAIRFVDLRESRSLVVGGTQNQTKADCNECDW